MAMDPELRYDKLKPPFIGNALVDLVNERYAKKYDVAGGVSFISAEEMEETVIIFDTTATDKEIDRLTGFPKNQYSLAQIREIEPNFPTYQEVYDLYQEYLTEYDAYAGKRERLYPSWKEQLDLIYHSIDSGALGEEAKTSAFYTTIKEIKESNL